MIGKYAYERGQYQRAVEALEEALDREGPFTQLGGDIQLWLALAYNVRKPRRCPCNALTMCH
jgi:tetratricopeptide (TPR) repeat protein